MCLLATLFLSARK
uniref:Uncharacterized protein n=1 Tax=Rhizophora mucronata TaxID=61149 RepID=A0A2P2NC75_RHIMU